MMSTPKPIEESERRAIAKAGAWGAVAICLVHLCGTIGLAVWKQPEHSGWIPIIFFFAMPWIFAYAMAGALIGKMISNGSNFWLGIVDGVVMTIPVAVVQHLVLVSPQSYPSNHFFPYFLALLIGFCSAVFS